MVAAQMNCREESNSNLPPLYAPLQYGPSVCVGVYVDFIAEFQIKICVLIIFLIKSEHLTCFLLTQRKSEVVIQVQIWGMTTSIDFQNIRAVLQP